MVHWAPYDLGNLVDALTTLWFPCQLESHVYELASSLNVRIARCRWFDSVMHPSLGTCICVRGPGRWVGIARQDCSYEPEPTIPT